MYLCFISSSCFSGRNSWRGKWSRFGSKKSSRKGRVAQRRPRANATRRSFASRRSSPPPSALLSGCVSPKRPFHSVFISVIYFTVTDMNRLLFVITQNEELASTRGRREREREREAAEKEKRLEALRQQACYLFQNIQIIFFISKWHSKRTLLSRSISSKRHARSWSSLPSSETRRARGAWLQAGSSE